MQQNLHDQQLFLYQLRPFIIVRIMTDAQPTTSCTSLLKQIVTVPVPCQYVLLLMNFMTSNQENFQINSSIYNTNTRNKHHLHRQNAKLSFFQKSTLYAGIKVFNNLPPSLKICKNYMTKFQASLRKYLNTHYFHSVNTFLCVRMICNSLVNCW